MQHAVSYQPSAPARAATASSRLSSLFSKGLRKSASARDLVSEASRRPGSSSGAGGATVTPLPLSASAAAFAASPQLGEERAPGGALGSGQSQSQRGASGSRDRVDSSFIPYHGPIAPPPPEHSEWKSRSSTKAGQFADEHGAGAARPTGEVSLPAPNVGPAFGRGQFERSFMFPKHSEAVRGAAPGSAARGRGPYGRAGRGGSSGEVEDQALVGLGLSSQAAAVQQQTWRAGSSGAHSNARAASAFAAHEQEANERLTRFFEAGHTSSAATSPTPASPEGRLNVGYGLPTAYVHGGNTPKLPDSPPQHSGALPLLPSLMRADYREAAPPTREPLLRTEPHAQSFAYRAAVRANASTSSVADVTASSVAYTPERRTGTAHSISSNEGGSAGDMTASQGFRSASTSMTSLRAPSQSAAAASQAQAQQHVKWPSSTTGTPQRSQEMLATASASGRAAASRRGLSSSSTPDLRKLDTAPAPAPAPGIPAQARIPPPRWDETPDLLAPKTAQRTPPTTIWASGAPLLSPIAASTQGDASSPGGGSRVVSTPENPAVGGAEEAATREAWRRYNLLQQLHLDEVASHAPENAGFLDADNGCERILMPRPRLRSRVSVDSTADSHAAPSFERNRPASQRRAKAESNPDLRARARAHERMARAIAQKPMPVTAYDLAQEAPFGDAAAAQQPFFHHRMPPAPPAPAAAAAEEQVPGCAPHTLPRPTRQRASVQPLRFPVPPPAAAELLVTPPTPGLSPGFSDAFPDEPLTPDLETVLAQGAALERDRAQWRREHARSIGGGEGLLRSRSRSRDRRSSTGSRRRKAGHWDISEPIPIPDAEYRNQLHSHALPPLPPKQHKQSGALRHSRSSPQLGQVNRRDFGAVTSRPHTPPSPNVPTSFLPFFGGGGGGHARSLSRDSGVDKANREGRWKGMFRKKRSRASTSAATGRLSPTREREQLHAASLATQRRMRSSQSWDNAMTSGSRSSPLHLQANTRRTSWRQSAVLGGRFTPVPVDEVRGDEVSGRRKAALVSDEPVVIGRGFDAARAAAESAFRFPPNASRPNSELTGEGQYGFAISSPRPELALGADPPPAPLAQGRHAMQVGYHRPSNSADLRALLATSLAAAAVEGGGSRGSVSSTRTRESKRGSISTPKRSSSLGRKAAAELRDTMAAAASSTPPSGSSSRRNSLGMSSASRHAPPPPKPDLDELQSPPQSVGQSLPVPPRKPRLSGTSSPIHQGPLPPPPSLSFNKPAPAPFTTPFSNNEGFGGSSLPAALSPSPAGAFFTPPLGGTPLTAPGVTSYFTPALAAAASPAAPATPEATPRPPQQETPVMPSHLEVDSPPALPDGPSPVPSSALGSDESPGARAGEGLRTAWRRRVGHSSSSDSSMSQRSTAVRELWTTDDHQEESFSGLFIRRPSAAGSGSEGSSLSRERVRAVSLASSGEMDPAPPGEMPASSSPREVGTPKSQNARGEAVLREARSAAASYRAAMLPKEHPLPESAEMGGDTEEELSPVVPLAPAFEEHRSSAASRLGRMGAELQAAAQMQSSPNPSEAISSTLIHGASSSAHGKEASTPGLVAASFIDFDQGLSAGEEGREDISATSSMLGVPAGWSKTSRDSHSGSEGLDSNGEQRRRSTESSASIGFASLVKPRVWPEPPKSSGHL